MGDGGRKGGESKGPRWGSAGTKELEGMGVREGETSW